MKILPIYQNTPQSVFGAFMEGNLPTTLNYDLQTVLNNMVSGRVFLQNNIGVSQQQLTPISAPGYQVSPAPAWTTVQGYRGKRVLPKVTFSTYSTVYQDLAANLPSNSLQLDMMFFTILAHRTASTVSAYIGPCIAANSSVPPVKTVNADGSWTLAEYDFGAEVVVNSLAAICMIPTNNLFSATAGNLTFLQVQQGSSWVDVTNINTNLSVTTAQSEKYFQLPATVQGRRWRVVSKAATNPFPTGLGPFILHFYGDYASGTSPRTLAKIQHAVIMPTAFTTVWGNVFLSNGFSGVSYGRYFAHYGLSVTDDLKQAANFDLVINDATVYPAQEQAVSSFTVTYKPIATEVY